MASWFENSSTPEFGFQSKQVLCLSKAREEKLFAGSKQPKKRHRSKYDQEESGMTFQQG